MNESTQVFYQCQRCGNCCRWPGLVRVEEHEIDAMAEELDIGVNAFLDEYCDIHPNRSGLVFKNKPDGACIFLEGVNTCRIQAAKPIQCQGFPNTWNFPGWQQVCEAKVVKFKKEEVKKEHEAI
ncbi:MAG: YkgJ family cysteine cluster protein [Verrucomicrobiota bacterium]